MQQGNETAHATARFQIREQRYLSCWSREFALAEAMEKLGGVRLGLSPDADGRESFVYQITAST